MFDCSKCGICCQHINSPLIKSIDGVCINYNKETKLCNIYETRPLICRVDDAYKDYFSDKLELEEYMKLNYDACKELQEMYNVKETD